MLEYDPRTTQLLPLDMVRGCTPSGAQTTLSSTDNRTNLEIWGSNFYRLKHMNVLRISNYSKVTYGVPSCQLANMPEHPVGSYNDGVPQYYSGQRLYCPLEVSAVGHGAWAIRIERDDTRLPGYNHLTFPRVMSSSAVFFRTVPITNRIKGSAQRVSAIEIAACFTSSSPQPMVMPRLALLNPLVDTT